MEKHLQLLHLDDDALDAELIHERLRMEGLEFGIAYVHDRKAYLEALEKCEYDLILSDFAMPDFDGAAALKVAKSRHPETPFIFVSGTIGEDAAIESLVAGATDYVLKQGLNRLAPAVKRALREAGERRERKQLEAKLLQAQKMEVVGRLASGVVHDFNNLLMVILGHVHLLLDRNVDPDVSDSLKNIHRAADSAGNLIRQLLTFSRKQPIRTQVLDVNAVISDMGRLLSRVIGGNVDLRIINSRQPMHIQADLGMLDQVLMNLVVNAKDAMPEGGEITISANPVDLGSVPNEMAVGGRVGEFILLTVADTGIGIPPEAMHRIFEPFFTTKEAGKGTGLGLSTVYSIIEKHQGWIEVHGREEGAGTEFRIWLPAHRGEIGSLDAAGQNSPPSGSGETILVVEDNKSLRKLVQCMLEEQNYKVLEAGSGKEALELWDKHESAISLFLTDLIMPDGMTGHELAQNLRRKKPGLKVLYTSGYGIEEVREKITMSREVPFLQKPFNLSILAQAVRNSLDDGQVG